MRSRKPSGAVAKVPGCRLVAALADRAERRATFAATPEQDARRPGARTRYRNLLLAGDWTNTGLPATIESAIRSGHRAAEIVTQS
jgi:uncharacterized protein with NAD-binding domain and iron-sulfur cluster